MNKRYQVIAITSLFCSLLFSTVSTPISAGIINLDEETINETQLFEELLISDTVQNLVLSNQVRITNREQAQKAVEFLIGRFREYGEIAMIDELAPGITQFLPNNVSIRYLYAIALAAQGKVDQADKQVSLAKQDSQSRLFYLLARASIAKKKNDLASASNFVDKAIKQDARHPFSYNLLGQIQASQKSYQKSKQSLERAIKYAPKFSAAHSNLGSIYFLLGQMEQAWDSFSASIALTQGYCPALIGRSSVALLRGDRVKAVGDLESCLAAAPNQLLAIKRLVPLYLENRELNKAEELVKSSAFVDPMFFHQTRADIYLRRNNPAAAREQLSSIKEKNAQTLYLLSFCDQMENRPHNAIRRIKQAEKIQPESVSLKITKLIYTFKSNGDIQTSKLQSFISDDALGSLAAFVTGSIYASQREYGKALKFWSQAQNLVPGMILKGISESQVERASTPDEQIYLSLGMLYYLKGYYSAAIVQFDKAISINSYSFLGNFFNALALTQVGKPEKVTTLLKASLKNIGKFFPANYMLAENYLKSGNIDKAIRNYNAAAEVEADPGVLIKLALLHEKKRDFLSAGKTYRALIENHPDNFLGYNQLAWLYAKQGINLEAALKLAYEADSLRPGNVSVNDTLGWLFFHKKDYKNARKYLVNANEISRGKDPDVLFHLASVQYELGEVGDARESLNKALSLSKNFESRKSAELLTKKIDSSRP